VGALELELEPEQGAFTGGEVGCCAFRLLGMRIVLGWGWQGGRLKARAVREGSSLASSLGAVDNAAVVESTPQ
jgi:hypothetical protein